MRATIFSTPILNSALTAISKILLRLLGWRIEGQFPTAPKFVLVGAPHTSNWDFMLMLLVVFAVRADVHWMGKDSLFPKPFDGFMRWLGGIAVDRSKANNTVEQMIAHYQANDELIVIMTPEGTRSKVSVWKTGFYHIAKGAEVPIVLGYIDGAKKVVGLGKVFTPAGDLEQDMAAIKAFYADKQGLRPELT
ncbi:lysophospholipid acyltransferase family protein [Dasania sp. GY-MA-18]|uniref:Lysophospholipid acyltransferase family protein n=1 Tax=Dasania phycosphaerae TaxID=2950436 RepID=A0A9J6RRB2_9GAMM|nr:MULTISPECIES: lysophospholipid acyltransferase family protein [Dasania]MCR8924237.1 lysophospholipid acyltransferase family protein [Dasania sp. GY-MA-18]MCZ0866890.1 lysophospholipid acyltransferase family protein [Dasania phycosphaerae]MCZ0870394.1 lysophospholipid acyltransferase family protein [Dasania phycosphaerae]